MVESEIKEHRISCEDQKLKAANPRDDINLCPDGNGYSAFSQQSMRELLFMCESWKIRARACENTCQNFADTQF